MNASRDEQMLHDPHLPAGELHRIASTRPDLAPLVARHPQAYPELLEWLGSLGNPEVDRALSERQHSTRILDASTPPTVKRNVDAFPFEQPSGDTAASAPPAQYAPATPHATSAYAGTPGYAAVAQPAQQPQKRGISTATGILLGIVIALILALIVMWQVLSGPGDNTEGAPSPETTTVEETTEEPTEEETTDEPTTDEPTEEETTEEEFTPGEYLPDAPNMPVVSAPSGNIACAATEDGAWSCTIMEYEFTPPEGCTSAVTVYVSPEGETTLGCGVETEPGGNILDYGQTARLGDSAGCTSTESGMQCWSGVTNSGINIARAGISEITGP